MIGWLKKIWRKRESGAHLLFEDEERRLLIREIRKAHAEWLHAQKRLDYVLEWEQIDYAIYSLEAARKRYEMLLRQAKKLQAVAGDYYPSNEVARG